MADDQQRRRQKRLARQKKKRGTASRPSRDRSTAPRAPSVAQGRRWPAGECYLSTDWSGAMHAVFVRSHEDGRSVAAFVQLDRSGPGISSIRIVGLPGVEHVLAECGRISQESDVGLVGAPPGQVVGILVEAAEQGALGLPKGWTDLEALVEGIEPDEPDPPFGPREQREPETGLFSRLLGRFLG